LTIERDPADDKTVANLADEQDPEQRGDDSSAPSGDGGAADDHTGDDVELVANAAVGIGAARLSNAEHAGDSCHHTEEREHAHLHAVDVHSGELGRAAIASECVDVLTKSGAAEQ